MNHTLKSITLAAAASLAVVAHADEKSVLDLLVKKGTITAEERGKLLEESKAKADASGVDRVFPKEDATKRLTISGYFQTQYQNFLYSDGAAGNSYNTQGSFMMRRLYVEFLADVGEGLSGDVVFDMSGNTANSVDRAMVSLAKSWGTLDVGYRKVAWGYEESTLSSLFKASSSKLYTVERGITNRYWNEQENGTRLGFGAHHLGLHYSGPANPQGFEYGASVVNAAQGFYYGTSNSLGANGASYKGNNDVGLYANLVYNYKVSDSEKYAAGVNYGNTRFDTVSSGVVTQSAARISGYNPFVQAQYFNTTLYAEYMVTKLDNPTGADYSPKGVNATVAYKFNDNWEGVFRYTNLDTDGRGQKIGDGVREFNTTTPASVSGDKFNKSNSYYVGLNYYFSLTALGATVTGPNAKVQFGYERAEFSGDLTTPASTLKPQVDSLRAQFQVAF